VCGCPRPRRAVPARASAGDSAQQVARGQPQLRALMKQSVAISGDVPASQENGASEGLARVEPSCRRVGAVHQNQAASHVARTPRGTGQGPRQLRSAQRRPFRTRFFSPPTAGRGSAARRRLPRRPRRACAGSSASQSTAARRPDWARSPSGSYWSAGPASQPRCPIVSRWQPVWPAADGATPQTSLRWACGARSARARLPDPHGPSVPPLVTTHRWPRRFTRHTIPIRYRSAGDVPRVGLVAAVRLASAEALWPRYPALRGRLTWLFEDAVWAEGFDPSTLRVLTPARRPCRTVATSAARLACAVPIGLGRNCRRHAWDPQLRRSHASIPIRSR
jgi:hypothetical protein